MRYIRLQGVVVLNVQLSTHLYAFYALEACDTDNILVITHIEPAIVNFGFTFDIPEKKLVSSIILS